jgi:hypothetical protein
MQVKLFLAQWGMKFYRAATAIWMFIALAITMAAQTNAIPFRTTGEWSACAVAYAYPFCKQNHINLHTHITKPLTISTCFHHIWTHIIHRKQGFWFYDMELHRLFPLQPESDALLRSFVGLIFNQTKYVGLPILVPKRDLKPFEQIMFADIEQKVQAMFQHEKKQSNFNRLILVSENNNDKNNNEIKWINI